MGAVVFCNIAWMKNYQGITDEDQPYNGGSFVKENNDAMEQTNLQPTIMCAMDMLNIEDLISIWNVWTRRP